MIKRLLLVEDTIPLAEILKKELLTAGFTIEHTSSGNEAVALHEELQPDLIILDWMLPDIDGLEVLKTIRSNSNTPVIMLTAKSEEIDRILGLEIGADDYITKPFSVRELIARIHAIQRRIELVNSQLEADRNPEESPIILDNLGLYPMTHHVKIDDNEIALSRTEFDLLHLFMRNPNRVFSRPYLIETIWEEQFIEGDRSVDNLILRLRKKIKNYGERIETVWGVGYRFSWKK
jgi:DNA-binding response OmpR family regulator